MTKATCGARVWSTMSNSAFLTGCTERRAPFRVTIMSSRPLVVFSTSSGTTAGNASTNLMSTMNQIGFSLVLACVEVLVPLLPCGVVGIAGACDLGQAGHARRIGVVA